MSDLIRRSDVIEALKDNMVEMGGEDFSEIGVHSDDIDAIINDIPSIEPKRGEWAKRTHNTLIAQVNSAYCSECGQPIMHEHTRPLWSFCPNCGADMRGKDDE